MANLTESATWDAGVYRIETSDPVLGGEGGPSNAGAKNLANRTTWLKARLAGLGVTSQLVEVVKTASGSWTVPAGVTQILVLEARAPGGGGAGCWSNTAGSTVIPGGGGGEGTVLEGVVLTVTPADVHTITFGTPGAGGAAVANDTWSATALGADGGTLQFGTLFTLAGGKGGGSATPAVMSSMPTGVSVGGDGGSTTVNTVPFTGNKGSHTAHPYGGGRGGGIGGGKGGVFGASMPTPTAGTRGGGGGGGAKIAEAGAAGGAAILRFLYVQNTVTGNT